MREILLVMHDEYLIEPSDAVIAIKETDERVKLNQLVEPVTQDLASGKFWRSLIGLLFMIPVAGAVRCAAPGAIGRKYPELGINDEFMTQASRILWSGHAALFLLIRRMTTDKVLTALHRVPGAVMRSPFNETKEQVLHAALAQLRVIASETVVKCLPPSCLRGVWKGG